MSFFTKNRRLLLWCGTILGLAALLLTGLIAVLLGGTVTSVTVAQSTVAAVSPTYTETGTVRAADSHDVLAEGTRTVESVAVVLGQKVNAGDVLLFLTEEESRELTEAKETLAALKEAYAQLRAEDPTEQLAETAAAVAALRTRLSEAEAELQTATQVLAALLAGSNYQPNFIEIKEAEEAIPKEQMIMEMMAEEIRLLTEAQARDKTTGVYTAAQLDALQKEAVAAISRAKEAETAAAARLAQAELTVKDRAEALTLAIAAHESASQMLAWYEAEPLQNRDEDTYAALTLKLSLTAAELHTAEQKLALAETAVETAKAKATEAETAHIEAENTLNTVKSYVSYEDFAARIKEFADKKAAAQERLAKAEAILLAAEGGQNPALTDAIAKQQNAVTDAAAAVQAVKQQLTNAEAADEAARDRDEYTAALQQAQADIDMAEARIEALADAESDSRLLAPVDGTVAELPFKAGEQMPAGAIAVRLTAKAQGYTVELTVPVTALAYIQVGDSVPARTPDGGTPTARVLQIDSADTQTEVRRLTLAIEGAVQAGDSVTVTLGGAGQSYDNVIPLAAIREDGKGTFVLIAKEKRALLRTEYIATRVDVEIVKADETHAAVLGDLAGARIIVDDDVVAGDSVQFSDTAS